MGIITIEPLDDDWARLMEIIHTPKEVAWLNATLKTKMPLMGEF